MNWSPGAGGPAGPLTGRTTRPYVSGVGRKTGRPLVLGHRGYRAKFPENTLLAFREALAAGADGVECDLQKTRDGSFVVIHDPATGRVADGDREVGGSGLGELRALDFGGGEKIPTLEDLLRAIPRGAWLDLELKEETLTSGDCGRIAAVLDAMIPRDRLMISSFDPRLLYPMRARGFTVGLLVGEEVAQRGMLAFAGTLLRLRPRYVNLPVDILPALGRTRARQLVRVLRAIGLSILFWTVNTPAEAAFAIPLADMVVTDEVELVRRAVFETAAS